MREHYERLIKVKRLKTTSGSKKEYVATATADCAIQPLGKSGSQFDSGVFGKEYVAYCDADVPVEKGDMVTDDNGVKYSVMEVVVRDYGAFPYKQLTIRTTS